MKRVETAGFPATVPEDIAENIPVENQILELYLKTMMSFGY